VLGISCDSPADNLAFQEKFNFPYDLLCDEDRSVSMAYGAAENAETQYPARISYLIDPEGRIAKVYGTVAPADHPEQVLADLG
jgi:peroxiredoxin Q/BCP